MKAFTYSRAGSLDAARAAAALPGHALLAGGTTLLDLAKLDVLSPGAVIDISRLPGLDEIRADEDGASIGALAKMSHVADHDGIREHFPAVAQTLALAASPQLRNMATIGGNLMQRTRCTYFRDPAAFPACNKRNPGSGCSAIGGMARNHAILGTSEACIATYPGDLAVALVAFDAVVHTTERAIAVDDFFLAPEDTPKRETVLAPGEVITRITLPASRAARTSTYLKVRDRQSYEFAAASAAVGVTLEADGCTIEDIRVAIGGVATRPWRARTVEDALRGQPFAEDLIVAASRLCVDDAVAHDGNKYKIDLAPRVVARAILQAGGLA